MVLRKRDKKFAEKAAKKSAISKESFKNERFYENPNKDKNVAN